MISDYIRACEGPVIDRKGNQADKYLATTSMGRLPWSSLSKFLKDFIK